MSVNITSARSYALHVEFESAWELKRAITAIELLVPSNDEHSVMDAFEVEAALHGFHSACFVGKGDDRPAIMPARLDEEDVAWRRIAANLLSAANSLQEYIDRLDSEIAAVTA